MLSVGRPPSCVNRSQTLYHYLIGLNYGSPVDVLDAQTTLSEFLRSQGLQAIVSSDEAEKVELIYSVQPKWLDLNVVYVQSVIDEAPPTLTQSELKKWVRRELLERFRFAKNPPHWLQAPAWPFGSNGPLVFLGQVAIANYFHDEAAAYVFYDPATGQCQTLLQVC